MSVMPYSLRNILVGGPQMSEYEDVIRGPPTLIYYFLVCHVTVVDTLAQCHHKNSAIQAL